MALLRVGQLHVQLFKAGFGRHTALLQLVLLLPPRSMRRLMAPSDDLACWQRACLSQAFSRCLRPATFVVATGTSDPLGVDAVLADGARPRPRGQDD